MIKKYKVIHNAYEMSISNVTTTVVEKRGHKFGLG